MVINLPHTRQPLYRTGYSSHHPTPHHTPPRDTTRHDTTGHGMTRRHTTPHHTTPHHTTPHHSPRHTTLHYIWYYTIPGRLQCTAVQHTHYDSTLFAVHNSALYLELHFTLNHTNTTPYHAIPYHTTPHHTTSPYPTNTDRT